jgi:UDP-N-acetylmuramoyl-tripeptide--D-alanyl-D-alanine ligase
MLTLADILEALTSVRISPVLKLGRAASPPREGALRDIAASLIISEASIDSRLVIPGGMFVALPGERSDGHDYVNQAITERGAHLVLIERDIETPFPVLDVRNGLPQDIQITIPPLCLRVENCLQALQKIARFWRRQQTHLRVIGVTGSVGKSTTKEIISEVLSERYRTLKNPGNLNNEIGLPLSLLRLGPGYERAVLEMGFYMPGEIRFLCDLALPQVGVVTNIGTVHAERAGSQEDIARGKAELIEALPPAPEGWAILNYDDPWVRPMAEKTQARVFFYGLDPKADLWADDIESFGLEGIHFRMHYRNEVIHVRVPLIGRHSVHTALRAAAVGLVEGLTWQEIVNGLQRSHVQLRMVAVHTAIGALLLDDTYNASPESTLAALNLLNELEGRKVAVLGEMYELGRYERQGHEVVGARAAEVCSELVAVGELARIIAESAHDAGMPDQAISWVASVPEAVELLATRLRPGDVALVKGSHGLRMDRLVTA